MGDYQRARRECPCGCDAVLRVYGALHCPEATDECGGWYQPGTFIEHMQEKHNEEEK